MSDESLKVDLSRIVGVMEKFKIPIKIIGVAAIIMAFFLLGFGKYHEGRFDECLEHDGFYLAKEKFEGIYPSMNDFECIPGDVLLKQGLEIDKANKVLVKRLQPWAPIYN